MFLELSGQRMGNGFGPNPLQYTEIEAWQRMKGRRLRAWERNALLSMDRAYLVECAELAKPPEEQVSDEPLTGALFDRLFGK